MGDRNGTQKYQLMDAEVCIWDQETDEILFDESYVSEGKFLELLFEFMELGKSGVEKIELRPFTKHDWYGFAGAECPAKGIEPFIFYGTEVVVLVDKMGIGFYGTEESVDDAAYHCDMEFNKAFKVASEMKTTGLTHEYMESLGFECTNLPFNSEGSKSAVSMIRGF